MAKVLITENLLDGLADSISALEADFARAKQSFRRSTSKKPLICNQWAAGSIPAAGTR